MDLRETTLSAAYAFKGQLLKLRVDEACLPNGDTATREVVEHPGGVGILALTDEGDVLLVEQFRYPYAAILTEIPAGKREPNEHPLATGKRELIEETGATADNFTPLGTVYPTPGYCDEVIHLYLATGLHFANAHPDADEFLHLKKMPLSRLIEEVMIGNVPDAKTQIAALKVWHLLNNNSTTEE